MSNKSGPDTGDVWQLLADADALLEQAYYASDETDLCLAIGQARYTLAQAKAER